MENELGQINATTLTPVVRAALDSADANITEWRREAFGHSLDDVYGTARSIFRFSGSARVGGEVVGWSLVLKVVTAAASPDDPSSPANGEREPFAYRSGLLDQLSGVRAPRCFGVIDRPGGGYWLWLEEIVESIGREWPKERYLLAARHLGQFNGAVRQDPRGSHPWLSRSPLREAVREMAPSVALGLGARDNPYVSQAISSVSEQALRALLHTIEPWMTKLDQLPQCICHWDAHRANLMSQMTGEGRAETVLIDWAGVGWGPLGAELSKLLSQTVNFFGMREDALPALDVEMFAHYIDGLRASGWNGDPQVVRFGHVAASAARLVVRTSFAMELALNERKRAGFERAAGLPFAALAEKFSATLPYYLSLVTEAEQLARLV